MNNANSESGLPLPLSGATRIYAIVGDPILQVGSPSLFNQAFRCKGAEAVLVPFHLSIEKLDILLETFRAIKNFDGLVITVPHKIKIAHMLDIVGPMAQRIGAVNAIRKLPDGRLLGDNFDGLGFLHGLKQKGICISDLNVLLVGAGGAGSAIAHALIDEAPRSLEIADQDCSRAEKLLNALKSTETSVPIRLASETSNGYDVIINCTPLGMSDKDPLPVSVNILKPHTLVVDIILKPLMSPLLNEALKRGCRIHTGNHMLSGQVEAICGFFELLGPSNVIKS